MWDFNPLNTAQICKRCTNKKKIFAKELQLQTIILKEFALIKKDPYPALHKKESLLLCTKGLP